MAVEQYKMHFIHSFIHSFILFAQRVTHKTKQM